MKLHNLLGQVCRIKPRIHSWLVLGCVLLIAGCGQNQQAAAPSTSAPVASPAVSTPAPSASPAASPTAGPTATPAPGPGEFANPVIDQDFPDPDILKVGDTYYAYATNVPGNINVQTAKSTDLVQWQHLTDAMPSLPQWAFSGYTWAPEVTTWDDGKTFVLYYTARHGMSSKQCIGVATSTSPEGPFQDTSSEPFVCQLDQGGSIDVGSFKDEDGTQYVLWKNDGNCCGQDTFIYIQRVSADGLRREGEPVQLIKQDQFWEGLLVEAPTLWRHENRYYLFYSANSYDDTDYAAGYATADTPTGPFTKAEQPLLKTDFDNGGAIGPGGQDIVVAPSGETWLAYHSWNAQSSYRRMQLDPLRWENGTPVVDGPKRTPQPRP